MNTEAQNKAHQCAERAAYYQRAFHKHMWTEIVAAALFIPLGIITFPFGVILLIMGGACIAMAFVNHVMAQQSHKEFFELREGYLKEDQYDNA